MSPPAESRWSSGYFGSSKGFDRSNPILRAYPIGFERASRDLAKAVARVSIYPTDNRSRIISEALQIVQNVNRPDHRRFIAEGRGDLVPSAPCRHVKRYSRRISPRLDTSKGPWSAIRGSG